MNEQYNLNELAMMTGMTTRTLRSDIAAGMLSGEKIDGMWTFTAEEVERYMAQPAIRQRMTTKQNALVYDFLADTLKTANQSCVVLDFPVSGEESDAIRDFFCAQMCAATGIRFFFQPIRGMVRVALSGPEEEVRRIMAAYYGR